MVSPGTKAAAIFVRPCHAMLDSLWGDEIGSEEIEVDWDEEETYYPEGQRIYGPLSILIPYLKDLKIESLIYPPGISPQTLRDYREMRELEHFEGCTA